MTMHKTGQSRVPMGKQHVPWPSKTLIYKGEKGGFVPQPQVTDKICPACGGAIVILADKSVEVCQQCEAIQKPEENS